MRMDWSICYQLLSDQRKKWCRIATMGLNTYSIMILTNDIPSKLVEILYNKYSTLSSKNRRIFDDSSRFWGKMEPLKLRFLGDISIEQGNNTYVDHLPGKAIALICYLAVTNEARLETRWQVCFGAIFLNIGHAAIYVIPSPRCAVRH